MNEYLREEMNRQRSEEDARKRLAEQGRSLSSNAEFVRIDWTAYQYRPALALWHLVALAAGINPEHYWAKPANAKKIAALVDGEVRNRIREMLERLEIATWNLERKGGTLRIAEEAPTDIECTIRIQDFKDFSEGNGWELPDAFPGNNRKDVVAERGGETKQHDGDIEKPSALEELTAEARRLAQEIGMKKYAHGERNISIRNVAGPVAKELAKNQKWHGIRGPRDADSIRSTYLKGWKFTPPEGGTSGTSGMSD